MFNSSEHPQVKYSLSALSDALFRLMAHDPYESITVTAICQEAQMTRRTFYRNCESKMDLVAYKLCVLIQELLDTMDLSDPHSDHVYRYFFTYWLSHRDVLHMIYQHNLFGEFLLVFTRYCTAFLNVPFFDDYVERQENRYQARQNLNAFIIGGLCNLLQYWVMDDFNTDIEALVSILEVFRPDAGQFRT